MQEQPLVSIIIPTFNRAHLIGETLDSVLAQTYQNWECIVVDDGSTDGTDEVMAEYMAKDTRFQYHHRPEDRLPGGNAARNYGFEVSKGEYINFLDSDDFFHPNKIELKVNMIINFKCDVVISEHTKHVDEFYCKKTNEPRVFKTSSFDVEFILSRNRILIGDPMIKRRLLNEVKFDEDLKRGQDHSFFIALFKNLIKYCLIDTKLYLINVTPNSITQRAGSGNREMSSTQITIHKKMINAYGNIPEVVFEYERKTRKMYKGLMTKHKIFSILKNYHFYRKCFKLNNIEFAMFFIYNSITNRGYDKMRKNI
ncbi:glycosyltransferase family 2 protein [Oceanihabitans sediminis]|uniref:glycosyltransferase family 2 protein n=1 Tax=Oceanihabitans sediminis TaxID=1812012 RepID=UPI003A95A010